jgi:hypothetical protein
MAPCFSVLSSEAGGQFFFTLETRIFKPVVFDRFQTDADTSAKRGQSYGQIVHVLFCFKGVFLNLPTLRAMIFRRLCTPKRNNDAMHRFILFEAQIHETRISLNKS